MSLDQCIFKQLKLAYVIIFCCVLLVTIASYVDGLSQDLQYDSAFPERYRQRRQQFTFPLEQIFQFNTAGTGSATQVNIGNDFTAGNGVTTAQDGAANAEVQQQAQLRQFSQAFSNLIEAASIQQTPNPQEIVRTVMNSGLK